MTMSTHAYLTIIAGLATYIATLPGPTQVELLRLLEKPSSQRGAISTLAFLGSAITFLVALLHAVQGRRRHQHQSTQPLISTRAISSELKNVRNTSKAYVHVFVKNIILRAINKELVSRLEHEIKETATLKNRIQRTKWMRHQMNSTVVSLAQHRDELLEEVRRLSEREQHMKHLFTKMQAEFSVMPEEYALLDQELTELRKANEELQEKSLQNTRRIATLQTNAYSKQVRIESLRSQVRNLSKSKLKIM